MICCHPAYATEQRTRPMTAAQCAHSKFLLARMYDCCPYLCGHRVTVIDNLTLEIHDRASLWPSGASTTHHISLLCIVATDAYFRFL